MRIRGDKNEAVRIPKIGWRNHSPCLLGTAAATAFLFTSTGSFEQPFSSGEDVYRRRRQQSTCQYRARCPMFRRNVKTTRLVNFTKAPTPLKRELDFRILRGCQDGAVACALYVECCVQNVNILCIRITIMALPLNNS